MSCRYFYLRYKWFKGYLLEELAQKLSTTFTIVKFPPKKKVEERLTGPERDQEIEVKADTLFAFLSATTATLFQKEKSPFTKKDLDLRKVILELYPHITPSPLPMGFSTEPKFEIKLE